MSNNKNLLPTEKDFSGAAVQQYVFKETIQHPATIIPLGVAGGFTGLMILGLMSMNPVTLIVPLVAGLAGGGAWIYNYSVRGKEIAARYIQDLRNQLETVREEEIRKVREKCSAVGFEEGQKEANELETAYLKLRSYLEDRSKSGQELDAARYQSLARDIYREGLKLISSAFEAQKALKAIDIKALRRDKEKYAKQLERAEVNSSEAKSLQSRIKNHDDRIVAYDRHSEVVFQLMDQLEGLEGALENAYLELVDLSQGRGLTTTAESANRLEQAVQAARRVEDKLRGIRDARNFQTPEDEMYLKAGKSAQPRSL